MGQWPSLAWHQHPCVGWPLIKLFPDAPLCTRILLSGAVDSATADEAICRWWCWSDLPRLRGRGVLLPGAGGACPSVALSSQSVQHKVTCLLPACCEVYSPAQQAGTCDLPTFVQSLGKGAAATLSCAPCRPVGHLLWHRSPSVASLADISDSGSGPVWEGRKLTQHYCVPAFPTAEPLGLSEASWQRVPLLSGEGVGD